MTTEDMMREAVLGLLKGNNDPYTPPIAWTKDEICEELESIIVPTGLDAVLEKLCVSGEAFYAERPDGTALYSIGLEVIEAAPAPDEGPSDDDGVNFPDHYRASPSGVECIQVTEHMNFCRGNAMKYLWRAGLKDKASEARDLAKARWYITREIARITHQPWHRVETS
jgi:hypothetical protein